MTAPQAPTSNEIIEKTLAEDAKRRDEQRKQEEKSNPAPQKEYEFHPIADIFPLMMGDEFKRFKNDNCATTAAFILSSSPTFSVCKTSNGGGRSL